MKKKITLIFVPLFLLLFASYSFSQQSEVQPVEFKKISDRLYEIVGGRGANGGAYIGDNAVLIIDAKMDQKSVDQVIKGIEKIADNPIKYLVNTHSDGDHVTGNQYFPETVTLISHENCRKELFHPSSDGTPSEWNKPELAPFIPSLTFRDKMDVYLGSMRIELWYFGIGHTTGDTVVYFPEEKTAFLGDQIFLTRPQLIHSYKGGNSFEHVKTLVKMLDTLNAEKFCSGHSEIADREAISNHIDQMKKRQEKVKELIEKGKSLEEIKSEFEENEARLIESIYNEIKSSMG
ncbi:MAG: MBL fold metallo-hydrolase [Candidatus Aminicenantes bacterium]|nr:MBL fold metallo-hydrolase [Candidatus Aminicenantes bacterium]MDH5714455.1 MBL fold metallo-hydrolase [Candidatus Aminicenantes bacterium]